MKTISVDRLSLMTIRNDQCDQILDINISNNSYQTTFDYSNEIDVKKIAESIDYILTVLVADDADITVTFK